MIETMPSKWHASRIVREYGYHPAVLRGAIIAMRRRGIGWKEARKAVLMVNAALAGQKHAELKELFLCL